jgi:putative SOS response-associated peptidase YedK
MCGRFSLSVSADEVAELLPDFDIPKEFQPRYNIAPGQPVPTALNFGCKALTFTQWGLVPGWAKDPAIGHRMINARAETLHEKPSFKGSFRRKRCLIIADGFYEWKKQTSSRTKQPVFVHMKNRAPFAFAGLWDEWNDKEGGVLLSSTIITVPPNDLVARVHNRMPAILRPSQHAAWLSMEEDKPQRLQQLLKPYPAEEMEIYPVSSVVNNPTNDSPECLQELKPPQQELPLIGTGT